MNENTQIEDLLGNSPKHLETKRICDTFSQIPLYGKIDPKAMFAIIEMAIKLDMNFHQALTGGLSYSNGRVILSIQMMHAIIRSKKHSITQDRRSDDTICILHGKRSDNGDTWAESFSLEDAQRAGLTSNPSWSIYPTDLLFDQALLRLALRLFPDIIGIMDGCHIE